MVGPGEVALHKRRYHGRLAVVVWRVFSQSKDCAGGRPRISRRNTGEGQGGIFHTSRVGHGMFRRSDAPQRGHVPGLVHVQTRTMVRRAG